MSSSTETPDVNTLVDIRFPDGLEYPSRVEGSTPGTIRLTAPFGGSVEPPAEGDMFHLCWSVPGRGLYIAPIRLLDVVTGAPTCWRVAMTGPTQLHQRRRFVRGGGGESVRVSLNETGQELTGQVVDISEASMRCWVAADTLPEGQTVTVKVGLDQDQLAIPATVIQVGQRGHGHGLDVVMTFDIDEEIAGQIRRHVLRHQILARRSAADAAR
jgi:PilZ domain